MKLFKRLWCLFGEFFHDFNLLQKRKRFRVVGQPGESAAVLYGDVVELEEIK